MEKAVDGVILAAGLSSRMRKPKPLLEVGTGTFALRAVESLRAAGCRSIALVANAGAEWAQPFAAEHGLDLVLNEEAGSEQVDSLRLAIRALPPDSGAVVVLPVDLPLISSDTVRSIVAAWRERPGHIFLPFHNAVAGHPVLLDAAFYDDLLTADLDEGLRSFIMDRARHLREVKVDDPGILIDIDTPDDYWRYIEAK